MKTKIVVVLLVVVLTACAPVTMSAPTVVSPTVMPTATFAIPTPSALPTEQLIPILTPDAIQVARWKEYQAELAKLILLHSGTDIQEHALCEWDILGNSGQEVYVWAVCFGPSTRGESPAVIYLEANGGIQMIRVPIYKPDISAPGLFSSNENELFPPGVVEKIQNYSVTSRAIELRTHLEYRMTHLDMPPLIILNAMLTMTPSP